LYTTSIPLNLKRKVIPFSFQEIEHIIVKGVIPNTQNTKTQSFNKNTIQ
jgi:hypothetical protein